MRKKIVTQRKIFDQAINQLVTLLKPEKKLKKMDAIIDSNPDIVKTVHKDLTLSKKSTGRKGISAERVLRCAVLKQYKSYSYRELLERINRRGTSILSTKKRRSPMISSFSSVVSPM